MIQKVEKFIRENDLIQQKDKLYIGVSGGADSVCLLLILSKLRAKMDFSIQVIHVEHGIRGEDSRNDARFVENLCKQNQIPYQMNSVDVPQFAKEAHLGLEEAARILRYQAFVQAVKQDRSANCKVVLAHHMDDNAETILFQMIRGSGLTGMCGMKPIRTDADGVCYIRPLLSVSRKEIEQYLDRNAQEYCTDATNFELDYSRNRIRNIIIPELEKLNDQAVCHINQTAASLTEVKQCLDAEVETVCKAVMELKDTTNSKDTLNSRTRSIVLNQELLEQQPLAIVKEVIRKAVFAVSGKQKDITSVHINDIIGLFDAQSGKKIMLPYDICVKKEYHRIILETTGKDDRQEYSKWVSEDMLESLFQSCKDDGFSGKKRLEISTEEGSGQFTFCVRKNDGNMSKIPKKPYTKWLDYDMIKHGFFIRNRCAGDYFYADSMGHRKKLKDFFINEKIPASERNQVLLLARESQVFWIVGNRISEDCKVTEDTTYIFEVEYYGGN